MINSFDPKNAGPNGEVKGEALKRIQQEYGTPEAKNRDPVKKLGKDEFFKIMVTQIQNQDPTSPYKNEEMASQMAQFTSLEQMFNVNQNLEKLADSQQPLHQLGAAGLIGKFVTSDSSHFVHTEGKYSDLNFDLPVDAGKVKIAILNQKGEVIREIEKSDLKKGQNKIEWDGRRSNNMLAAGGAYSMRISAESTQGKSLQVNMSHKYQVHGVGFEGKDTVLLVGDQKSPQKILLKAVAAIEDASSSAASPIPGTSGQISLGALAPELQQLQGQVFAQAPQQAQEQVSGSDGRVVPRAEVGQSGQFAPVDPATMRAVSEKPDVLPPPTQEDIKNALEARNDLSDANPSAKAIAAGKKPAGTNGASDGMEDANPLARRFGQTGDENSISGRMLGKE